jgi:magnesium transporter
MDPDVVTFPDDERCGEALRRLRRLRHRVRYYVYVTDRDQRLVGVVTLRDLMHAPPSQPLASLARRPVTSLHVRDSHSNVLRHTGWRLFHALPVVDDSDIVVGIVRYETLRRLEAETTDEPAPSMMAVGTALGQTWLALATVLLDGFAGSLSVSREANESKEVRDG